MCTGPRVGRVIKYRFALFAVLFSELKLDRKIMEVCEEEVPLFQILRKVQ